MTVASAGRRDVVHLIYVCAFLLDAGESVLQATGGGGLPPEWERVDEAVDPLPAAGWHDHPSSYAVCTQDQAIPPRAQRRMATRCKSVHTLDSSHSPFLSRPGELAAAATVVRQACEPASEPKANER